MRQGHENEQGTVLLTTLLIMAVMATVSIAIIDDIRFGVKRIINVGDYAQVDWYLKGGEDFTRSYIQDTLGPLSDEDKNIALAGPQDFAFPFDGGAMSLLIRDGSHCFALGSLVTLEGQADDVGARQFQALLTALGWPENPERTSDVLTDWIDSDQQRRSNGAEDGSYLGRSPAHRTANIPLHSSMEMRSLDGMSEELYQALRPYICARKGGERTQFNIETARETDALVLAAILGGAEFVETALSLISQRPSLGSVSYTHLTLPTILLV